MRILVTGCSQQQCGSGTKQGYQPVIEMHVQALRDLGHEVTQRPVVIDDDEALTHDVLIVGQVPCLSVAGHHVYPALNLLERAEAKGNRVILNVDDWQFPRIHDNLMTVARGTHRITRESVFKGRPGYDWITSPEGQRALDHHLERMLTRPWPPVMYPAFAWGDHKLLAGHLPAERSYFLDPTSYTRSYHTNEPSLTDGERHRRWVLGVLSDQSAWLKTLGPMTWDLHLAGRPKEGAPAMQEADLVRLYADSWGVLSPLYKKVAGSGWWRNRFVYAAITRSVLLADTEEVKNLGAPYLADVRDVEACTTSQLRELAEAQAACLRAKVWNRDRYLTELEGMIRNER